MELKDVYFWWKKLKAMHFWCNMHSHELKKRTHVAVRKNESDAKLENDKGNFILIKAGHDTGQTGFAYHF